MVSSVERVCAGALHNDAVKVAVCLVGASRLRAMHCSWLAGGGTQGAVSGERAALGGVGELGECGCEILREKRLSGQGSSNAILAWFGTALGSAERLAP